MSSQKKEDQTTAFPNNRIRLYRDPSGEIVGVSTGIIVFIVVISIVFLALWIAGLVKMRRACPDAQPSLYWILTLVLGLVPTGVTQLAALIMACVGLGKPSIGCVQ